MAVVAVVIFDFIVTNMDCSLVSCGRGEILDSLTTIRTLKLRSSH